MNRKLIRLITFIITVTLLGSFAIGCQYENKDKTTDESNSLIEKLKPGNNSHVTLKFASFYWAPINASKSVFNEVSNRSINSQLNISLEYLFTSYYVNRGESNSAFGRLKDADAFITKGNVSKMVADNNIMDLTDLLPQYAPSLYSKYTQSELDRVTFDGRTMGIPMHFGGSGRLVAVVRQDLLDLTGIKEINTLDDYGKFMDLVKGKSEDIQYPGLVPYDSSIFLQKYGYSDVEGQLVYKLDDPSMKLKPWEQTDECVMAVKTIKNWYDQGYIPDFFVFDAIAQNIESKSLGSFVWYWDEAKSIIRSMGDKVQFKVFPLYPYAPSAVSSVENTYSIVINKNSKNAARVIKFLEWIYANQENYDLVMYGVKEKDYELADNRIRLLNSETGPSYYLWGFNQVFYNSDYDRSLVGEQQGFDDFCSKIDNLDSNKSPAFKFIPNLEGDIGKFMTNREWLRHLYVWKKSNVEWLGTLPAHTSASDFNSINELVDKALIVNGKVLGIEKLLPAVQRQLDNWLEERKKQ